MKSDYKNISITLLGFDLFIITYPFWAKIINLFAPSLTKCAYNEMTGKLCPFCGATRMMNSLWHGNFDFEILSIPTLVIIFYLITNIIFRIIYLFDKKVDDDKKREKVYKIIDITSGASLCIYVAIVIIIFIINNIF